jgi:TatD DNase family protein
LLIDTHCHLADAAYASDRAEVLERAWAAGVARVVVIGESRSSAEAASAMAEIEPRLVATAGVHPHHAGEWNQDSELWL